MLRYFVRRLLVTPLLFFGVMVLIFLLLSMLTPHERASPYVTDIPKRQGAIVGVLVEVRAR